MKVIKPNTISAVDGSFSRASIATYWNSSGVLSTVSNNIPRIGYDPISKEFQGIVIESASTNNVLYSEDFSNAAWQSLNNVITTNVAVAPDGNLTADKQAGAAGTTSRFLASSFLNTTNNYCTGSVFVKAAEYPRVRIALSNFATDSRAAYFDVSTGTSLGTDPPGTDFTSISSSIEYVGNGWYRCSITALKGSTNNTVSLDLEPLDATTNVPTGDGTSGIYYWGAQLELGQSATSYIPTTSTAATRQADTITGSGLIYTTVVDPNPDWLSGTTYALGAKVHYGTKVYESLQASNTNHQPDTSPTWWISLGADNQHAAFDNIVSTSSSATQTMTFILKPGAIDSIALINMDAATVNVALTDATLGTVYTNTAGLSGAQVYDWYQYFFYDPLLKRTQIVFGGIPQYANGLVTVRIEGGPSEIISVAQMLFGLEQTLGGTQYGASAGIIDYSTKETDQFGNITFVERAFSKRLNAQVFIDNTDLNRVQNLLYSIRATPVVWIGSDDPQLEEAVVVFGFYREFSVDIGYPTFSMCSLDIEGLS